MWLVLAAVNGAACWHGCVVPLMPEHPTLTLLVLSLLPSPRLSSLPPSTPAPFPTLLPTPPLRLPTFSFRCRLTVRRW